ncbi:MAG: DUF47 family protein [Firmicutes bacterium]|nr:DUF47 family protein [Bacillota bacterium]
MSWKDIFVPSQQAFYDLLAGQMEVAKDITDVLQRYISTTVAAERSLLASKASELEHEGDRRRKSLMDRLEKTFVTPIDREDLNDLSRAIDDIVDYNENTIKEIAIYQIQIDESIREMVETMQQAVAHLTEAITQLSSDLHRANQEALTTKSMENKMEGIYRRAIAQLTDEADIHYIIKVREVYRHLSNAADRADGAADVINSIVVKQTH